MGQEYELKLEIASAGAADHLAEALNLGDGERVPMRATYFDTPDLLLARHGMSLRIRQEGRRLVQTLKAAGSGGLGRHEWERPIRGNTPVLAQDSPAIALLDERLGELTPCWQVDVIRRRWTLTLPDAEVEIAFDQGTVTAGQRSAPVSEVEIELKSGDPAALFDLARRMGRLAPLRLGVLTKSERGERLVRAAKDSGKASDRGGDKGEPVRLSRDMTAGDAFRAIVLACVRHYRLNEARLMTEPTPLAVHQARVALRRLRSALRAFRPLVGGGASDQLNAELRWLTNAFGPARDIDVLLPRVPAGPARRRLEAARTAAYARLDRAIQSQLVRELMLDLVTWTETGKWTRRPAREKLRETPARDFAAQALGRLHARLATHGRWVSGADDEERHELRKTGKKLRYTAEFFAALFNSKPERKARLRYLAALEALQEVLGDLNDLAMLPHTLERAGIPAPERPAEQEARRAVLLLRAREAMAAFEAADCFWE